MELKLTRKSVKITYDDVSYDVSVPTTEQIEIFLDEMNKDKVNSARIVREFLMGMGLPEEIVKKMDIWSMNELVEFLSAKKK